MLRPSSPSWLKRVFGLGHRGALARTPITRAGVVGRGGVNDLVSEFFRKQMRLGADRIQRFVEYEVMDEDDLPSSILDLYAEDATQLDHATGRSVWITSKNEIIMKLGEQFLRDVMRIEDNVFGLARDIAKYGEAYDCPLQEEDRIGMKGPMIGAVPLDPKIVTPMWDEISRLSGYQIGMEVGHSTSKDRPASEPWSLLRYTITGRDRTGKGGTSVFQPARRCWRRLRMVEDALMMLRLKIAPDRLYFKVKNLAEFSTEERRQLLTEMRDEIRKKRMVDPATGTVQSEIEPWTVDDDFYVDSEMVDVDMFKGNTDLGRVLDVEYWRKRFLGTVRVPPDYVGFSDARGGLMAQSPLCQQDVQFCRSVKRIQRAVITGLVKAFQIDLCWRGINPYAEGNEFAIHMVPISGIDEKDRAEVAKTRAEAVDVLMGAGTSLKMPQDEWIQYVLQVSGFAAELNRFNPEALSADWRGVKPAELLTAAARFKDSNRLMEDALVPGYMSSWYLANSGLPPVAGTVQIGRTLSESTKSPMVVSPKTLALLEATHKARPAITEAKPTSLMEAVSTPA